MSSSWELCIGIQENCFRFAMCKLNNNETIEVSKAFQVDTPQEFRGSADDAQMVDYLKKALKDNGISAKTYSLCLSDRDIINRVIKLPKMKLSDLKSFMKLSIQQYFPIKVEDYSFDYKIQSIDESDEKAYYSLFLVAIPKATIEFYANVFLKCGLRPNLISIYSDVISNLFIHLIDKDVAIMDMGYNFTEFVMLEGRNIFINSTQNYSLPKNTGNMAEEEYLKNLSEEQAGEEFFTTCDTLENYINFFSSRHHGKSIEEIYFIGEASRLGFLKSLEKDLNIKVVTGQELLADKIIVSSMPAPMRSKFYPERYCCCFGLLAGGINNAKGK